MSKKSQVMMKGASLRSSVFYCFPCDQESNCETGTLSVGCGTKFIWEVTY